MVQKLRLASSQSRTLNTTADTIQSLEATAQTAARMGVDLILFPEAFIGGYPRSCAFGSAVGARDPRGRDQFLQYFRSAVDLGDTPEGAGDDWVDRKLPVGRGQKHRGDGTRERLESIASQTGVFIASGLIEKAGGSLYCSAVYVCPRLGCLGKRRKVMPTGTERLVWAQGQPSTLRAVTTIIRGVKLTLAAAICWENYMPLLRQSLYSQNVNLYLAPTADARDTWLPLQRTIGIEGRTFVLSANQCVRRKHLPDWIRDPDAAVNGSTQQSVGSMPGLRRQSTISRTNEGHEISWPTGNASADDEQSIISPGGENGTDLTDAVSDAEPIKSTTLSTEDEEEFLCRGGSCIVSPFGEVLAGPLWEVEDGGLLVVDVDFDDCERGRLDLDVAGSYSRNDAFKLTVSGLDATPPP